MIIWPICDECIVWNCLLLICVDPCFCPKLLVSSLGQSVPDLSTPAVGQQYWTAVFLSVSASNSTSWSLCFSYECESASAITRSDCGLCLLPLVLILCHRDVTAKSGQIRDQPGNKNLKSVRTVKVIFDDFWYFWICLTESAPTASECQGQRDSHTSALETSRT